MNVGMPGYCDRRMIVIISALLLVFLGVSGAQDFQWSWEKDGASPTPDASVPEGSADAPGSAARTTTTVRPAAADAYNKLLEENLSLRKQLQETDRGAESMRAENARLRRDIGELEERITESVARIGELKAGQSQAVTPDQVVDLEARLATAEGEKARMADELKTLQARLERGEAEPPLAPQASVKPGSDLFMALEEENAELRDKLSDVERARAKTEKQLREVKAEAAALASAETETEKHREVIRRLMDRIPDLENQLADARSDVKDRDEKISERERELRALAIELERREQRLKKAERIAVLMARTKGEVQQAGDAQKRDMHYNMAVVYANRGDYREAEKEYLRALRLDPSDADAHYNLGILYEEHLGSARKAASHYRRYLRLRPNAPDLAEVRTWIGALEAGG